MIVNKDIVWITRYVEKTLIVYNNKMFCRMVDKLRNLEQSYISDLRKNAHYFSFNRMKIEIL